MPTCFHRFGSCYIFVGCLLICLRCNLAASIYRALKKINPMEHNKNSGFRFKGGRDGCLFNLKLLAITISILLAFLFVLAVIWLEVSKGLT